MSREQEIVTVTFADGAVWRFKGQLAQVLRAKYDQSRLAKPASSGEAVDKIMESFEEISRIMKGTRF